MSQFRFYIKPFQSKGIYDQEVDVTDDVIFNSIGNFSQKIDQSEFEVGFVTFGNVSLSLDNKRGRYNDAGDPNSVFRIKRDQSLVVLKWFPDIQRPICGSAVAGISKLSEPIEVFRGVISDDSTRIDVNKRTITFTALDVDSVLKNISYPSTGSSSKNVTEILQLCLQPLIDLNLVSSIVTVETSLNILVNEDESYGDSTCKDVLDSLARTGNFIFYVKNETAFVVDRSWPRSSIFAFYSTSSLGNQENIIKVDNVNFGLRQVFNVWESAGIIKQDTDSVELYGERKNEPDLPIFSGAPIDLENTLQNFVDYFGKPKLLLNLTVVISTYTIDLAISDWVTVDIPPAYFLDGGYSFYGNAKYGEGVYPVIENQFSVSKELSFIVTGRVVNIKQNTIQLTLREV